MVQIFAKCRSKTKTNLNGGNRTHRRKLLGDTVWGVCNGKGLNHLGRLLMDVRKKLKEKSFADTN